LILMDGYSTDGALLVVTGCSTHGSVEGTKMTLAKTSILRITGTELGR
jgi:hypothetical protein